MDRDQPSRKVKESNPRACTRPRHSKPLAPMGTTFHLRDLMAGSRRLCFWGLLKLCPIHRGKTGIRTLEGVTPTRFRGGHLQPLGHLSSAVGAGFEPAGVLPRLTFQISALSLSANLPRPILRVPDGPLERLGLQGFRGERWGSNPHDPGSQPGASTNWATSTMGEQG